MENDSNWEKIKYEKEIKKYSEEIIKKRIERFKEKPLSENEKLTKEKNDLIFNDKSLNELPELLRENNLPDILKKNFTTEPVEFWDKQIDLHDKLETKLRNDIKTKGLFRAYWKSGKLGIDKYAILFPFFFITLFPLYFYFKNKNKRLHYEKLLGPNVDYYELETSGSKDLDDISRHEYFYNKKRVDENVKNKLKLYNEIDKLENELFRKK